MKKYFLILVCGLVCGSLSAQNFPEKSEFGGVEISFSQEARNIIDRKISELQSDTARLGKIRRNADLYLPFLHRELKNGFHPTDFVYYAAQVSGLDPLHVGPSGGKGFWDFNDTRAGFGKLSVSQSEDARMHPVRAGAGFVKFSDFNKRQFENWGLVLISLYKDIPEVRQSYQYVDLQDHKGFKINDTEDRVLTFFALRRILRADFGKIMNRPMRLRAEKARVGDQVSGLAKKFGISESEFKKYNPWLMSNRLPEDNFVMLPADPARAVRPEIYPIIVNPKNKNAEDRDLTLFTANGVPAVSFSEDVTLAVAADLSGVSKDKLLKYNDLSNEFPLKTGEIYYLKSKNKKATTARHILQRDETLWDVSQKYGLRLRNLHKNNRINERSPIKAGLVLWLNAKRPSSQTPVYQTLPEPVSEVPIENIVHIDTVIATIPADTVKKKPVEEVIGAVEETAPAAVIPDMPEGYHTGSHWVLPNDTWDGIAEKNEMTVSDLKLINPTSKSDLSLSVGSYIKVWEPDQKDEEVAVEVPNQTGEDVQNNSGNTPNTGQDDNGGNGYFAEETTYTPQAVVIQPVTAQSDGSDYHVVQHGETIFRIAEAYGVSVQNVLNWNGLTDETAKQIDAGQQVRIREYSAPAPAAGITETVEVEVKRDRYGRRYHDARKGESTQSVARKYLVSVYDLERWNHLGKNQKLPKECRLYVEDLPPALAQKTHHTIQKNETLFSVSRLYDMPVARIMELNRMSPKTRNVLLGTKLRIREDDEVSGEIVNDDNTSVMSQTTQTTDNDNGNTGGNEEPKNTRPQVNPAPKKQAAQPQTGMPSPSPFSITDDIVEDNLTVPQQQVKQVSFMKPQNTGYTEPEAAKNGTPEQPKQTNPQTYTPDAVDEKLMGSQTAVSEPATETPAETTQVTGSQKTLPDDYYSYTKAAESLESLAKRFNVSRDDLIKWNPGVINDYNFASFFVPIRVIVKDPTKQ